MRPFAGLPPLPPTGDRRQRLLGGIDIAHALGIEVGPLDKPLVGKDEGRIVYVDHADAAALRAKWAADPSVDTTRIAVDAVWGEGTLAAALAAVPWLDGQHRRADYVIASHVAEHVPDLVTWLAEVAEVLAPGGTLRLAVPDRRYTFDRLRRDSALPEVLDAWVRRRRVPSAARILDFALNFAEVDFARAWRGEIEDAQLVRSVSLEHALDCARKAELEGAYFDTHCWVFTPVSFARLMGELASAGLLKLACEWLEPTREMHHEFLVALRPEGDAQVAAASWAAAAESAG